jgi:NAD dependent epimerase/dehydratase family enzyme
LLEAKTPATRRIALRSAVMLSADPSVHLDLLLGLVRLGLGGAVSGGRQFVSWIHERDFVRAVEFLLERDDLDGAVNLAAPGPLPQREFMAALRAAAGAPFGLPATSWMAGIGAFVLRTDTELILKSRRVVAGRLADAGFAFEFSDWPSAARDLVRRRRARGREQHGSVAA